MREKKKVSRTKSENIFLKATKKGARKEKIKTRKAKNLEIRSKKKVRESMNIDREKGEKYMKTRMG